MSVNYLRLQTMLTDSTISLVEADYTMADPAFLSVKAASIKHGIPYWLMLAAVRSRRIKTVTLSKRRLIPAEALKGFMAEVNKQNHADCEPHVASAGVMAGVLRG
jgi:hypothetical protein